MTTAEMVAHHHFTQTKASAEARSICRLAGRWSGGIYDEFADRKVRIHCVRGIAVSVCVVGRRCEKPKRRKP